MQTALFQTEPKRIQQYRGLTIHADLGLHEQAAGLVRERVPAGATVLDVGAGAGAFARRLSDHGYAVTALDVDPEKWNAANVPGVTFLTLDIDRGIAASVGNEQFDAAVCLEVVEHVENPWNLLRELYAVVRPGGTVVLSTPNITSFWSRWTFLRTGRFHQFSDADLAYGHISPITAFHLTHAARTVGWQIRHVGPGGYLPILDLSGRAPWRLVRYLGQNLARLFAYLVAGGEEKRGWCLLTVLEKPAATRD